MAYLDTIIATARQSEPQERGYYESGYRIMRDGVPCRVFHKRCKEVAAQIAAIEIARDSGAELALDDAPSFYFKPVEGKQYKAKGAKPVPPRPKSGAGKEYYATGKRYIVGGIPCRLAFDKGNHCLRHWADGERSPKQLADWKERADDWFEAWEAGEQVEGYIRAGDLAEQQERIPEPEPQEQPEPVQEPLDLDAAEPPVEAPVEAPVEVERRVEGEEPVEAEPAQIANPRPPEEQQERIWKPLRVGPSDWVLCDGRTWLGHAGEFLWFDSREEALEALDQLSAQSVEQESAQSSPRPISRPSRETTAARSGIVPRMARGLFARPNIRPSSEQISRWRGYRHRKATAGRLGKQSARTCPSCAGWKRWTKNAENVLSKCQIVNAGGEHVSL